MQRWGWAWLLTLACGAALANDFPTLDRVQFVEECVEQHADRQHQEMLYKCACAVDVIAEQLTYEEYVSASTAQDAGQIAGERGTAIRESSEGRKLAKRFKEARAKAFNDCFIK
jgi:hypothetical protein